MTILKVSRNGQITLPKEFRDRFNVNYYIIEAQKNGAFLSPIPTKETKQKKRRITMKDLKKLQFKSGEKNLSQRIDEICYG